MVTLACLDDEKNFCCVCFGRLEPSYFVHIDKWLLLDAINIEGLFYHPNCVDHAWDGADVDVVLSPNLALKRVPLKKSKKRSKEVPQKPASHGDTSSNKTTPSQDNRR